MLIPLQIDENNHLNLTMEEIADRAGISRVYFQDLKAGRKNPKLEKLYSIAQAMQVAPGSLLPEGWQKKTDGSTLNEEIMRKVMEASFKIYAVYGATLKIEWLIDLILLAYKKYSADSLKNNMPVNDNIIYAWMEGKVG
jgi:transcriptional regulator with XRE-family HTH domain